MRNSATIFAVVLVVTGFGPAMADAKIQDLAKEYIKLLGFDQWMYFSNYEQANMKPCLTKNEFDPIKAEDDVYIKNKGAEIVLSFYQPQELMEIMNFYKNTEIGKTVLATYKQWGDSTLEKLNQVDVEKGRAFFKDKSLSFDNAVLGADVISGEISHLSQSKGAREILQKFDKYIDVKNQRCANGQQFQKHLED